MEQEQLTRPLEELTHDALRLATECQVLADRVALRVGQLAGIRAHDARLKLEELADILTDPEAVARR